MYPSDNFKKLSDAEGDLQKPTTLRRLYLPDIIPRLTGKWNSFKEQTCSYWLKLNDKERVIHSNMAGEDEEKLSDEYNPSEAETTSLEGESDEHVESEEMPVRHDMIRSELGPHQ